MLKIKPKPRIHALAQQWREEAFEQIGPLKLLCERSRATTSVRSYKLSGNGPVSPQCERLSSTRSVRSPRGAGT